MPNLLKNAHPCPNVPYRSNRDSWLERGRSFNSPISAIRVHRVPFTLALLLKSSM